MLKKILISSVLLILVAVGALFAINGTDNYDKSRYFAKATNGLKVGSKLEFKLPDQFDKPIQLTNDTKKVVFVFTKNTGHIAREVFKNESKDYLPSRNIIFVADISGMPTVIRNTFALPDFRESPYSVALIYDKEIAKIYKNGVETQKVIIATLKNKTITKVETASSEEELKKLLK